MERLLRGLEESARPMSSAGRTKCLILGLDLLSLMLLIAAVRVAELFGVDRTTVAALAWPDFIIAGASLVIALWHRRALHWGWMAAAALPWFVLAGLVTTQLLK